MEWLSVSSGSETSGSDGVGGASESSLSDVAGCCELNGGWSSCDEASEVSSFEAGGFWEVDGV